MKILICTFTFHPERNGVSEVATVQAFELARRGHEVTVACGPNSERQSVEYPSNLKVVEFAISGRSNLFDHFTGEVEEYRKFIAEFRCDAMLFHLWYLWPTEAALPVLDSNSAKKIMVSHGYTVHLWERGPRFPWGLGRWLGFQPYVWSFRRHLEKFDHVTLLSSQKDFGRFFDRTLMDFFGYDQWSVIPNGASILSAPESLPDFRSRFDIAPEELLLLNVANYSEGKDQLSTLRSFAEANLAKAVLIFIGGEINGYAIRLQEALRQVPNAPRVLILDRLGKEMIFAAYRAADLFVLSSKAETQPLAIIDAMACGVPFISTDTGCISEMPGGIVVSSEKEMTLAMQELAAQPERRKQLGNEGRRAVKDDYNWPRIVDLYEELLKTV